MSIEVVSEAARTGGAGDKVDRDTDDTSAATSAFSAPPRCLTKRHGSVLPVAHSPRGALHDRLDKVRQILLRQKPILRPIGHRELFKRVLDIFAG
jgi:hypothetical protein